MNRFFVYNLIFVGTGLLAAPREVESPRKQILVDEKDIIDSHKIPQPITPDTPLGKLLERLERYAMKRSVILRFLGCISDQNNS